MKNKQTTTAESTFKDKINLEKLEPCTTAASAEHSRTSNEDEPCDDGRTGNTNPKN